MTKDLDTLIVDAFIYGFPLYEVTRTRFQDFAGRNGQPPLQPNTIWHDRDVADDQCSWITTPNNDTLYSRAWLDLSNGPVHVSVDSLPSDRYWSIAFMDAFTSNFALLGQRLDGQGPTLVTLVGPTETAVPMATGRVIRAPGNDVWLLARWVVNGREDLDAARSMQECLTVVPSKPGRRSLVEPADAINPANFLAVVAEQMERNPPPVDDAAYLSRLATVGLRPSARDPWGSLPVTIRREWATGIATAHRRIKDAFFRRRSNINRWQIQTDGIGNAEDAFEWRAAVALGGLGALHSDEAIYAGRTEDDNGDELQGRHAYRLIVPSSGIPTDAFWSLSLYAPASDGRKFFAKNAIGRYSIGDRTTGLRYEPDGSICIFIQHGSPEPRSLQSNWLPAPAGQFQLTLRVYLPRLGFLAWADQLPTVTRIAS